MREERTSKPTGRFLKKFAGEEGFKSATITRLDRRLIYTIDYRDKSYQEMSFDAFKEMQGQMMEAVSARPEAAEPQEEPSLKCQPVKLEAKRSGEKETIAGYAAERVVITGSQTCENVETKKTCNMVYTVESWNAPAAGGLKELNDFYRRQVEAMGLDMKGVEAAAGAAKALIAQGTEGFEAVVKELSKVEGYPLRNRMRIEKGGNCGMGESGGGAEDPTAAMKDALKGLFGKKKAGSAEKPAAREKEGESSLHKVFGMSSEIMSISSSGASDGAFEPPAGFKKKETPKVEKP